MKRIFINLTPHPVVIMPEGAEARTVPASGMVARIHETTRTAEDNDGFSWTIVELGGIDNLPDPAWYTIFIVSMPLAMTLTVMGIERPDVVYPYGQVRDDQGRIIGCRSLASLRAAG